MILVTTEEMRRMDRHMIDTIGIPARVLMENAGSRVADEAIRMAREAVDDDGDGADIRQDRFVGHRRNGGTAARRRWLILAGKGNNGGDGLVAARHLLEAGFRVTVVYAAPEQELGEDAAFQSQIAARLAIPSFVYGEKPIRWERYDGIIDALLGTGTTGAPREPYASMIREANASGLPILAVDIPSGLDADTGEVNEPCIRAARTVALAALKRGLAVYPGAAAAGDIAVRPIGIPPALADSFGIRTYLLDETELRDRLQVALHTRRPPDSHKGTYGHALVIGGSAAMSGAGLLCAKAALRSGCGLATWAVPASLRQPLLGRLPEAMLQGIADGGRGDWAATRPERLLELLDGKAAAVIGPGMGRFPGDSLWLRSLWEHAACPLVLDADALNMIADDGGFAQWGRSRETAILTPHPGEMARLAAVPAHEVQRDRIGLARRYAVQHGVTLVLKGARTVVAAPDGAVFVNTTGNPGMATGGTGDVLAGVIGGLRAQGHGAAQAAALGAYLHGAAGDRAAAGRASSGSLLAGDIVEEL